MPGGTSLDAWYMELVAILSTKYQVPNTLWVDFKRLRFCLVDERCVWVDSPERNDTHVWEKLIQPLCEKGILKSEQFIRPGEIVDALEYTEAVFAQTPASSPSRSERGWGEASGGVCESISVYSDSVLMDILHRFSTASFTWSSERRIYPYPRSSETATWENLSDNRFNWRYPTYLPLRGLRTKKRSSCELLGWKCDFWKLSCETLTARDGVQRINR